MAFTAPPIRCLTTERRNSECVMAKVKVYRFRTYDAAKDDWFISTRMATREAIESSKTLELIPGTEAEIDSKYLLLGSWTDRNFDPRNSN